MGYRLVGNPQIVQMSRTELAVALHVDGMALPEQWGRGTHEQKDRGMSLRQRDPDKLWGVAAVGQSILPPALHVHLTVRCCRGQRAMTTASLPPHKSGCCLELNPISPPKIPVSLLLATHVSSHQDV